MSRVYVGNIEKRATKKELLEFLKPMEEHIEDSWLARRPPGFAFITIAPSRACEFVETFNGKEFRGKALLVELSTMSSQRKDGENRRRRSSDSRRDSSRRRRRSGSRSRHSDRRRDRSRSRSHRRDHSRDRKRRCRSRSRSSSQGPCSP
ncbi:RNA-binding protein, putative [Trypanosoma equiperdum]|uniref:RNA-binding protein, putative n=3 Tax=Trypanozoon TaxID=39700 RepID=Q38EQ1_TRYB2|nr:RBSR1 [Trypanosoma brucei gambiense DAL972]XP_827049.1 uncharacterized protein Tb09.160.5020 [Trypanosoma brucei brucei TREU927]EAN76719.1 RNA-binding protein, putative [Trypanosoma brucei brucei TREU927]CBH14286.1 RBSR1 [Trypanosoma brucei gambiense DAL972]SCU64960.1 RNA-binding protein, putative [Trypanosoma equiperdum]|eukprot:XP_011776556.1 RBSR1 [Trypanosoma brucei gambiense DAL972]